MIHYNELTGAYTLIVMGGKTTFPDLPSMLSFAKRMYGMDLLTQLN